MSVADDGAVADRDPDLALARIHLRLGSLALARAELETLAGRDALDQDGLVDLAEARWRTGDIAGAGEAASAALDDEDGPLLALIVAAEAAAARGRPTEARRLADRAMAVANGSIDALFAGMPRAGVWPPDATAPPPSPTTMFDPPRRVSSVVHRHPMPHEAPNPQPAPPVAASAGRAEMVGTPPAGPSGAADAATIGLWEGTPAGDPLEATDLSADVEAAGEAHGRADLPAGDVELDLGRAALEAGDPEEAAVRLGLVLRIAPALAPAVLELIEGRTDRGLALVRGDAYRLVGREMEARRAFIEAARGGPPPPPPEPEIESGPESPSGSRPEPSPEPADASADPPTDPLVDESVDSATEPPAWASAEGPTDPPAEASTDPPTDPPAEASADPATAPTDPSTEGEHA